MPSLNQHNAARADADLTARIIAAAEIAGINNAAGWAQATVGKIVAAPISGTTLADLHAYAVANYQPTPRPGADPAIITDAQIVAAVKAVAPAITSPSLI